MVNRIGTFLACVSIVLGITPITIKSQATPKSSTKPSLKSEKKLVWTSPITQKVDESNTWSALYFEGAGYTQNSSIPFVTEVNGYPGENFEINFKVLSTEIVNSKEELSIINSSVDEIKTEFSIENGIKTVKKQAFRYCKISPIRINKNGQFEKLIAYTADWIAVANNTKNLASPTINFATSSVLANGRWYKMAVGQRGMYKIDRDYLKFIGINPDSVDPRNIRIYGNGGRQLPESNSIYRPDDLIENAVYVQGESDGKFDDGDYLVFFGQTPVQWTTQSSGSCMKFRHKLNPYSDTSYYFLTCDLGPGKRVQVRPNLPITPTHLVNSFDDYQHYENNNVNLIKSGREWYGEYFDIINTHSVNFNFPNIVVGDTGRLEVAIANRMGNTDPNAYSVFHPGGTSSLSSSIVWLNNYTAAYASEGSLCTNFLANSSSFPITISKNNSSAVGWLNYIRLNVRRHLTALNNQALFFRDTRSIGQGNIAKFSINSSSASFIWDISDIYNIKSQSFVANANQIEFTALSDTLKEYVLFGEGSLLSPVFSGIVENQNLHAINSAQYIIIAHPNFLQQAQRLADFHFQRDSLTYIIATPQQCYNEFSSGSQDITAIRDFIRMIYKRANNPADAPKYLLLFGDGSYNYKNFLGNSNLVPTYQSPQSLQPTTSYTSDDFFGLLDDSEGDFTSDVVDIGIGRFPCQNSIEAENIVNKIIDYCRINQPITNEVNSCANITGGPLGDWRNWICFVADDEDQSLHLIQADTLANRVAREHPSYNINKIYFDSYKQESTPGGQSYPDANREFNKQIERGCLVLNYTGHGGELGLAHEGLVGISQIQEYNNPNNLPMWFTATCEFSRYDDPDRVSAGEYVFLNPKGAGIALFSTVRLVYASSNFSLSQVMWEHMLDSLNGEIPAMGDVFMLGKQGSFADANTRNFTLLGDPALKLAYPKMVVHTDSINGKSTLSSVDTLKALRKITIKGHVSDAGGNKLSNYNGIVFPVVFDKSTPITSLSNDAGSPSVTFRAQKNVIYKGKSTVKNGEFSFSFVVPKDIAYNNGFGRISYYAHDGNVDASGYFDKMIVGGSETNVVADVTPPEIKLFMNDNRFVSGGTTNENPSIYAEVSDSSGINTVGNGIGHDIVAILDGNSDAPIILNDYYQADMDKYQSGKVLYKLSELSEGNHQLSLKVWDVQNNSGTAVLDFVVAKSQQLALTHVLNYPNPFTTKTNFFIEHNNCCSQVNLSINVFTISGKVVKSFATTLESNGFRSEGIEWDGKDDFGDKLSKGVYIYKVKISDEVGNTAEQYEKLVILN